MRRIAERTVWLVALWFCLAWWSSSASMQNLLGVFMSSAPSGVVSGCTDQMLRENADDLLLETGGTDCITLE